MNVNSAIETGRPAASETVLPQGFSGPLLDRFVASETGEVETGEVHDSLSGPYKFRFGTGRARDDRERGKVLALSLCEGLFEWLWYPFIDKFIDFLVTVCQGVS